MEELSKDITVLIIQNLSIEETIALCKTSKKLNQICKNGKYNNFWRNKIALDFQTEYNGDNAYEEYKFLSRLTRTPIFVVKFWRSYHSEEKYTYLFSSLEKTKNFIIDTIVMEYYDFIMNNRKTVEAIDEDNMPELFMNDDELDIFLKSYKMKTIESVKRKLSSMEIEKEYNIEGGFYDEFKIVKKYINSKITTPELYEE